ncbi:YciI family protein [Janthinobacterium sp. UMAB-56]|uniref:YciI family protein n=1 Tax=Janthinobacterium sp. UMAB-56 TaxID=1365361 RepID=UPI001C59FBCC|nr:YciI family protein [Janthinobacterium sp. UMAB-56]
MYIVLLHYVQPLAAIEAHLEEHRRFLDRHYAAGIFLASGPQMPRTGGVILVKGLSREELDGVLAEDPFYREQIASYQVIEFNPTKFGVGVEAILT